MVHRYAVVACGVDARNHCVTVVPVLNQQMPIKWLALESIQQRVYTHKSDVWSYGRLCVCVCLFLSYHFSYLCVCLCIAFSALTLLVWHQEDHPAIKN